MSTTFPDPLRGEPLSQREIAEALGLLSSRGVAEEEKVGFLSALHTRGETAAELSGFARQLLLHARSVPVERDGAPLLELCGTGGDRSGFLNVSTAAMFVAAGAGARVVKHGNRAVSSRCGSADVLEALGVPLGEDPSACAGMLGRAGCVFLLATSFHPLLAELAGLRRTMASRGILTVFNLLGPLLNPASPDFQLTGVYRSGSLGTYAEAMALLGRKRAWAVHGKTSSGDGLDECSISGRTDVAESRATAEGSGTPSRVVPPVRTFAMSPEDFGLSPVLSEESLAGSDARGNALRIRAILKGEERGAARDIVVLNAAAALHVAGIGADPGESARHACESIDSGRALRSLDLLSGKA